MIKEVVILAGGFGTRLKETVPDLPKCMAPVAGKPFMDYIIQYFLDQGVNKFIFSLGYLHDIVLHHLQKKWPSLDYEYCIESQPLGTGGAIKLAMQLVTNEAFMVVNGDTLFEVNIKNMYAIHQEQNAKITLALKPMEDYDRYGSVILDENKYIIKFTEKTFTKQGLINGGCYIIDKNWLQNLLLPEVFSFEKDVLENQAQQSNLLGFVSNTYFIDIGIPEDFNKASIDLKNTF
jgi:D-glycero-alpha-D-manno-heptose 1-phosphate guanylyltransferase